MQMRDCIKYMQSEQNAECVNITGESDIPSPSMVSPRQSLGTLYAQRLWQLNLQSERNATITLLLLFNTLHHEGYLKTKKALVFVYVHLCTADPAWRAPWEVSCNTGTRWAGCTSGQRTCGAPSPSSLASCPNEQVGPCRTAVRRSPFAAEIIKNKERELVKLICFTLLFSVKY